MTASDSSISETGQEMSTPPKNGGTTKRVSSASLLVLAALVLFALVARVQCARTLVIDLPIRADGVDYLNYATNLVQHGFLSMNIGPGAKPDSFRSPGYPLLIAANIVASSPDDCYPFVLYSQAVLGSATVALVFFLGLFFLPVWASLAAAAAVALCPHLTANSSLFMTETLFSFLMTATALALLGAMRRKSAGLAVLAGLLAGWSYFTNETYLFLPLAVGLVWYLVARLRNDAGSRRLIILFLGLFLCFPVFWSIRNNFGLPEGARKGESRAYLSMVAGTYPDMAFNGKFDPVWFQRDPEYPKMAKNPPIFFRTITSRIKENPGRYLLWFLKKPYYFWRWAMVQGDGVFTFWPDRTIYQASRTMGAIRSVMFVGYHSALFLALAGFGVLLLRLLKRKIGEIPPAAGVIFFHLAYFTLLFFIFCPLPRYSVPLRPFLYLAATYGAWSLISWTGLFSKLRPVSSRTASCIAVAAALVFSGLGVSVAAETRTYRSFSVDHKLVNLVYINALTAYLSGKGAFHAGDYRVAREGLEKSLRVPEFVPQASSMMGRILFKQNKFEEAALRFRQALVVEPGHYDSLSGLALCMARLHRSDLSAAYFAETARRVPGNEEIRSALEALSRQLLSERRGQAAGLPPEQEAAQCIGRAIQFRAMGDFKNAEQEIDAALALAPGNKRAEIEQARLLLDSGKGDEAEERLSGLQKRFPGD
ncbi:MAG: tetratricopeptide repeat protein, partial [Thermodesulfobacteriota bacterium]